ncbi:MAG: hypothetical protein ACNA7W_04010 [Pseudomonadales bacterium]
MSRSLLAFLLFCVVLLVASAGVVWFMGLTLAGIAVDGERRQNPYYLLQLLPEAALTSGAASADSEVLASDAAAPSYRARFVTQAVQDQGRVMWRTGPVAVVEGSVRLDVAGLQLLEFATGGNLVQMLTSSSYRGLEASAGRGVHLVGSPVAPGELPADEPAVVVLYRDQADGPTVLLGAPGESGWLGPLPRYGGTVSWHAPVAMVRGDQPWNRLLVLQFPETSAAEAWLADPVTATERAIARKYVDSVSVLMAEPAQAMWR